MQSHERICGLLIERIEAFGDSETRLSPRERRRRLAIPAKCSSMTRRSGGIPSRRSTGSTAGSRGLPHTAAAASGRRIPDRACGHHDQPELAVRADPHARKSGLDAPASPVARVTSVTRVAGDDAGAVTSTAVRPSPWSRLTALELAADAKPRRGGMRRGRLGKRREHQSRLRRDRNRWRQLRASKMRRVAALDFTAGARLLQAALRGTGLRTPSPPAITSAKPLATSANSPAPELARGLRTRSPAAACSTSRTSRVRCSATIRWRRLSREPQAAWPAPTRDEFASSTSACRAARSGIVDVDEATRRSRHACAALDRRRLARPARDDRFAEQREPGDAANDVDDRKPPSRGACRLRSSCRHSVACRRRSTCGRRAGHRARRCERGDADGD